jgi:protein PhnA
MSLESNLIERAQGKCEMCTSNDQALESFSIEPGRDNNEVDHVMLCPSCTSDIKADEISDEAHWRCLNESIWSELDGIKVLSYRQLKKLSGVDWANDLFDMMYLDEDLTAWAEAGINNAEKKVIHKDSNGHVLEAGDSVVLIQDLNVKGANFTAKRGTAVRRIRLVHDNAEHIEGKVDGQQIVILTKYVKKSK